ncbi:histidine phosphatase family protein [Actinospica robiniae]|uniref:histidine phosphatase family protein n=1 Tax=Actinospica robiniae TaxID=304901 RepID=UPI000414782D|nr:histidine phosphatase family protein [Actinospica robiniae]
MTSIEFEAVYLARHGQTQWNAVRRRQGRLDSPLTELGNAQARANAALLASEPVDAVFASPLGRARTTAGILAEALGLPVSVCDDLAEIDHGALSGLLPDEVEAAYPGFAAARDCDRYGYRFPGGESYQDADARAARALAQVAASGARRPLLVSHEMIGRMLLKHLGGLSTADALALTHPSDVVYRVAPGTGRPIEQLSAAVPSDVVGGRIRGNRQRSRRGDVRDRGRWIETGEGQISKRGDELLAAQETPYASPALERPSRS